MHACIHEHAAPHAGKPENPDAGYRKSTPINEIEARREMGKGAGSLGSRVGNGRGFVSRSLEALPEKRYTEKSSSQSNFAS